MSEISAIKTEIREAMMRRLKGDNRPAADTYALASTALSELLAEVIFSAAKDVGHANRLLTICDHMILSRWRVLAQKFTPSDKEEAGR